MTDPIITTNDDDTWTMEWRSDEDVAPVHRIILETMFQIHNRYVLSHPRRTHDERMASLQATRASLEGPSAGGRPPLAPTGARAVLERLEALENQLTIAVGLLGARIEHLEGQNLTRAVTCPKCSSSWGTVVPESAIPITIACPFCNTSWSV